MKYLRYIDWGFCLFMVPLMTLVFPIGRWVHDRPSYALLLICIFYLSYLTNRKVCIPLLFHRRQGILFALLIFGSFISVIAALTYFHEGWPFYNLSRIYPHVDLGKVEMSQQRVWLAFIVVQLFSITIGLLDELIRQRDHIRQAASQIQEQPATPDYLTLKSGYKNVIIPLADILYIEAMDNYVRLHLADGRQQMSQITLTSLTRQLPVDQFVRIHKSFVVARRHVDRYTRQQVYIRSLNRPLPIGRTYATAVQKYFQ